MAQGVRRPEDRPGRQTCEPPVGSTSGPDDAASRRRQAVRRAQEALGVSERKACRAIGQARSTQRRKHKIPDDEPRLVARMTELAPLRGSMVGTATVGLRYCFDGRLRLEGEPPEGRALRGKRIERLWRREGLKVPKRQPKRRRLWLGDGSCVRKRAERPNHVWSYDFVADRTSDGRSIKILNIVDDRSTLNGA